MPARNPATVTFPAAVSMSTNTAAILAANTGHPRTAVLICNDGGADVYIGIGGNAVANRGPRLNANGGSLLLTKEEGTLTDGVINGITASGTSSVTVTYWSAS